MKRVDLIRTIEGIGCAFVRHGGKHDWYRNPTTGISQLVPRHREIKDALARHIIKVLSNPPMPSASSGLFTPSWVPDLGRQIEASIETCT